MFNDWEKPKTLPLSDARRVLQPWLLAANQQGIGAGYATASGGGWDAPSDSQGGFGLLTGAGRAKSGHLADDGSRASVSFFGRMSFSGIRSSAHKGPAAAGADGAPRGSQPGGADGDANAAGGRAGLSPEGSAHSKPQQRAQSMSGGSLFGGLQASLNRSFKMMRSKSRAELAARMSSPHDQADSDAPGGSRQ